MALTRSTAKAVDKHMADVEKASTVTRRWADELDSARREFSALEATSGDALLDDDGAGARLVKQRTELRDRIDVAERALLAANRRELEARSRVVRAEAATLDKPIADVCRRLDEHDRETDRLLGALVAHTGEEWRPRSFADADVAHQVRTSAAGVELPMSARTVLEGELEALERRRAILLAVADGQDPRSVVGVVPVSEGQAQRPPRPEEHSPLVWGPDAVLPVPAYLEQIERADVELAAAQEQWAHAGAAFGALEAELPELTGDVARCAPAGPFPTIGDSRGPDERRVWRAHVARQKAQTRLDTATAERKALG